jgi:hypothetical protein
MSRRRMRRTALTTVPVLLTLLSVGTSRADTGTVVVHARSHSWMWAVIGGLVLTAILVAVVVRHIVNAMPDEVSQPMRRALREQAAPAGVGAVLLIATVAFALYSMGLPIATSQTASVGNAPGTVVGTSPSVRATTSGPTGSAPPAASAVTGSRSSGSTSSNSAGSGASNAATAGNKAVGAPPATHIADANLFTGKANTRGITSNTITICGHAPLSLGPVFATNTSDLLVFWDYLNDKGGIYGRKFDIKLEDDQYSADHSVAAAQACQAQNPFLIFGAIGSDVIPPVRQWAEQQRELYLYGFAAKAGTAKFKYSFADQVSQEDLSLITARVVLTKFPHAKVGLVWRNSSNVQPGRDVFKKAIEAGGGKIVADLPTSQNQGNYTQEVIELKNAGANVVFMLDDALAQINLIKQSWSQTYTPNFMVFGFNIQLQALGKQTEAPPLQGTSLHPLMPVTSSTDAMRRTPPNCTSSKAPIRSTTRISTSAATPATSPGKAG